MYEITDKAEVIFEKGHKPASIKEAQREVREVYRTMCTLKSPQVFAVAKETYLASLGAIRATVLAYGPLVTPCIDEAARQYVNKGDRLTLMHSMYHMDINLPLDVVLQLKDVSAELATALRASGHQSFMFIAREMVGGIAPKPRPAVKVLSSNGKGEIYTKKEYT